LLYETDRFAVKEVTKPRRNLLQEKSKPETVPNRKPNEYNKKPMTGNFSLPSLIISKNVSKQFKLAFIRVKAIIISSLYDGFILKG